MFIIINLMAHNYYNNSGALIVNYFAIIINLIKVTPFFRYLWRLVATSFLGTINNQILVFVETTQQSNQVWPHTQCLASTCRSRGRGSMQDQIASYIWLALLALVEVQQKLYKLLIRTYCGVPLAIEGSVEKIWGVVRQKKTMCHLVMFEWGVTINKLRPSHKTDNYIQIVTVV